MKAAQTTEVMSLRLRRPLTLIGVLVLFALLPGSARAGSYAFTTIVDTDDGFDAFGFGCPAINDRGDVAVRATDTGGEDSIFIVTDTGTIPVVEEGTRFNFIGRNPSLNEAREASFAASLDDGGEAIFRGGRRGLTVIAQTDPGPFNFFGFDTSMDDSGRVAFKAELDNFDEGLFSGRGGAITTHYLASTSQFGGDDSGPSINDAKQIAFSEFRDDFSAGIFRTAGRGFVTIANDSGPIGFLDNPSLNDFGVVAFLAFFDEGGEAILKGSGGPVETVADTEGPFSFFGFDPPSLNNGGTVAFPAGLDDGGQGIFVGPDPAADAVIRTGDTLDGSMVTNLAICREGLNNQGQLAFIADLEDGRTGIFRATPAP